MTIYSAINGRTMEQITAEFAGRGYGDFKTAVGECVAEELRPIRETYERLMKDRSYLEEQMRKGAEAADRISRRTLTKTKKKIGLLLEK